MLTYSITRESLLKQYNHIFDTTIVGQNKVFQIQLIQLLCKNPQQRKQFINDPTKYLQNLQKYLIDNRKIKCFQDFIKVYQINIIYKSLPYMVQIYKRFDQIKQNSVGKWIVLTGTIIQSTHKKTLQKSKIFKCEQCAQQYRIQNTYHNSYRFEPPPQCLKIVQKQKANNAFAKLIQNFAKKKANLNEKQQKQTKMAKCGSNKFTPLQTQKVCIDYQQFRIQQHFKHMQSGKLPQNITIIIQGSIVNTFRPGDNVMISGVLNYRFKKTMKDMKMQCQLIILCNNITLQRTNQTDEIKDKQSLTDVSLTEYNLIAELSLSQNIPSIIISKQLKFRNQIVQSFCPNIFGRQNIKLGLLLALLGGVSYQNQNTKIRGQSHILLIGDPGTGKSVLIQQASNLAERSFFTNGIGTSSAGLSVNYYKQGNDWMIQAGALVLADNGVCVIDQLTLLAKKDEKTLLQAMEQQTISSAKASVVGKFNARTTIIAACNPITPGQKYNQDIDLEGNTGLSLPLLTRFDLILVLKDENDPYQDSKKCDYILENFCQERYTSNNDIKKKQYISLKPFLKKCRLFSPELSGSQLLSIYYTNQRKANQHMTTARAFQSLCRLTQAHAKLMMRQKNSTLDSLTAILLSQNKYFSTFQQYFLALQEFSIKFKIDFDTLI